MKPYIRYALRPVRNRYYTGKKIAIWQYLINYSFIILICIVGMIVGRPEFFGALLGVIVLYMLVDYFILDALSDKLAWKFIWKRFYGTDLAPMTSEQQAMKQFEQNPDAQNYEQLQQNVRRN